MPAVCRFFLKGFCRYGRDCRFAHPGENEGPTSPSGGGGGFSFTKALEKVSTSTATTNLPQQGFSFTRALQFAGNSGLPPAPAPIASYEDIEIDMESSEVEAQLNDLEIKAYQGEKFTFRLIPIRPPPRHLCS